MEPLWKMSRSEILITILMLITSPIHWIIVITVGLMVLIPAYIIRNLIKNIVQNIYSNLGPIVSIKDGIMAQDNIHYKPNGVLTIISTIHGSPSLKDIQQHISQNFVYIKNKSTGKLIYPKSQQYTQKYFGYNFWKYDMHFNIENHVKYLLPEGTTTTTTKNNDIIMTENELQEQLSLLSNIGFKPKQPHWEVLYIKKYLSKFEKFDKNNNNQNNNNNNNNNYDEKNIKSIIIFRIHHGVGDGFSLLKIFLLHLCQDSLDNILVNKYDNHHINILHKYWNQFYQLALLPYCLFKQLFIDIDSNVWFLKQNQLKKESHVTFTKQIPIHIIKEIRQRHHVSLTSVVYSALGGGIGNYFKQKYINSKNNNNHHHNIQIPKLLRSFTPFPLKNHPTNALVNHWTCAVIPILTGISCPLVRLQKCEEEINKVKNSSSPLSNYISMRMVGVLPGWAIELFGRNWYSTCILSNFPGPINITKFMGKYPIEDINFVTPHLRGNAGIGISIASYAENIRFTLNFDKAIIPLRQDLEDLKCYIEEEIDILYKSYIQNEQQLHIPKTSQTNMRMSGMKGYSSKQA